MLRSRFSRMLRPAQHGVFLPGLVCLPNSCASCVNIAADSRIAVVYKSHVIDDCSVSSASSKGNNHNPSSSVSLVSLTRFITQTINSEVVFQFSCNANLPLIFLEESSHEKAEIKYNMACVAITTAKTGSDLLDLSASLFKEVPLVKYL